MENNVKLDMCDYRGVRYVSVESIDRALKLAMTLGYDKGDMQALRELLVVEALKARL